MYYNQFKKMMYVYVNYIKKSNTNKTHIFINKLSTFNPS